MSTDLKQRILSTDSTITEKLGVSIGENLKGGEVIELSSDLGGGKTTLTRGLVRGSGSSDHVSSPTFTVSKVYQAGELQIHHLDLYRLQEAGIMAHEIAELTEDPNNVLVLEWAGVADAVLPKERLIITIETTGETERQIQFSCPQSLAYLLQGVTT